MISKTNLNKTIRLLEYSVKFIEFNHRDYKDLEKARQIKVLLKKIKK